jgi:hypothetical protein
MEAIIHKQERWETRTTRRQDVDGDELVHVTVLVGAGETHTHTTHTLCVCVRECRVCVVCVCVCATCAVWCVFCDSIVRCMLKHSLTRGTLGGWLGRRG